DCFFAAEDGLRDATVTGVQTCALPILVLKLRTQRFAKADSLRGDDVHQRASLRSGEDDLVDLFRELLFAEDESGARAAKCLVRGDRKSTRLNSSHGSISYAVFCLKKKK